MEPNPGNIVHKAGVYPEWDASPPQGPAGAHTLNCTLWAISVLINLTAWALNGKEVNIFVKFV